jgi:hypothetical protein
MSGPRDAARDTLELLAGRILGMLGVPASWNCAADFHAKREKNVERLMPTMREAYWAGARAAREQAADKACFMATGVAAAIRALKLKGEPDAE